MLFRVLTWAIVHAACTVGFGSPTLLTCKAECSLVSQVSLLRYSSVLNNSVKLFTIFIPRGAGAGVGADIDTSRPAPNFPVESNNCTGTRISKTGTGAGI